MYPRYDVGRTRGLVDTLPGSSSAKIATPSRSSSPSLALAYGSRSRPCPPTLPTNCATSWRARMRAALTKITGIGRKGAQRLILELADRLGPSTGTSGASARRPANTPVATFGRPKQRQALIGLGWSGRGGRGKPVAVVEAEHVDDADVEVSHMLALALRGWANVNGDDEIRIVAPGPLPEDNAAEGALRPHSLDEFIGQQRVRSQLGLVLQARKQNERTADHVLLSGPLALERPTRHDRRCWARDAASHQLGPRN